MGIKESIEKVTPYAALISLIAALITIGTLFFAISIFFQNQPTVSILDCPPSVYGGEELNVRVCWADIPAGWKLSVRLQESEKNATQLAESDASKIVYGNGEETFKLKVKPTTETHNPAKVCTQFYKGTKPQKKVRDTEDIKVYPTKINIINCSPSPVRGGEKINVSIKWSNMSTDWALVISVKKSDNTVIAEGGATEMNSSSGERTFKLKIYPIKCEQAKVCARAHFNEGREAKIVTVNKDIKILHPATVNIKDYSPSPVYGGEELNIPVSWDYCDIGWELRVRLKTSEYDITDLAEGRNHLIGYSNGETVFKLEVNQISETHDKAKISAWLFEGEEPIDSDSKSIVVLPNR